MAFEITEVEVWEGEIEGCPGAVSEQLAEVFRAGANLDVMISRPCPDSAADRPSCMSAIRRWLSGTRSRGSAAGISTLFLAPLRGEAQTSAATKAGLRRSADCWLRLEGPDRPWLAAGIARTLADAEIRMRTLTAAVLGERAVLYLSFESEAAARRAREVLKPVLD